MSENHNRNRDQYYDNDFFDEEEDDYTEDSYGDEGSYQDDSYDDNYEDSYDDNGADNYQDDGSYQDDAYGEDYDDAYGDDSSYEDEPYDEPTKKRGLFRKDKTKKRSKKGRQDEVASQDDLYYSDGYGNTYDDEEYDERVEKKHKKRRIALFIIELAALLVVVAVLYGVTRVEKIGKLDITTTNVEENISDQVQEDATTGAMKGYRNIALFGVDSTEGELDQNTRSDAILILSINEDTGEAKLVSVYRDTLMDIGDGEINKANAAYAKGGPEQALNMLNTNLDLNITDFITIGFGGLTDVINALGGIEIDVTEDEISHLNNYQSTMAEELGIDYTEVTEAGLQTLDGLQATAYCRIRYTSGWDYKRAARQRAVFYATFEKAKTASVSQLTEIANTAFSEIYTSYDLTDLISDLSTLSSYTLVTEDSIDTMSNGFPQEDLRIQSNIGGALGDCVIPRSLTDNVVWLHSFLFGDTDYDVTQTVQDISDIIDEDTADAVPEEMTDADHA